MLLVFQASQQGAQSPDFQRWSNGDQCLLVSGVPCFADSLCHQVEQVEMVCAET